jgi:phospholipase A1
MRDRFNSLSSAMKIFVTPYMMLSTLTSVAFADTGAPCAQQFPKDDAARLQCYDQISASSRDVQTEALRKAELARRSYLTRVWNLDDRNDSDDSTLGRLQPYRQNYLIVRDSNRVNNQPSSPAPLHTTLVANPNQYGEAKFLISVKADIGAQHDINLFGFKTLRLWGAYTQQSHWQVFNTRNSSPFRETNYAPELIATLGTDQSGGLKLINFGWEHQSNGRSLPESRSWNRIYMLGGWEWNNVTSVSARGWWRVPENAMNNDNPDILNYVGRADVVLRWEPADKSQAIALLLRNNLALHNNRGFTQIDWATPINAGNSSRVHLQLSSGYGESLIDYNFRQTTLGVGFSFREW